MLENSQSHEVTSGGRKKRKLIEGVTANSMVELKALLYEHQANKKDGKFKKIENKDRDKNRGVEMRNKNDTMKMVESEPDRDSYQNLVKKSELYDKMVRGEVIQSVEHELVDFDNKDRSMIGDRNDTIMGKSMSSHDMKNEKIRLGWEKDAQSEILNEERKQDVHDDVKSQTLKTAAARNHVRQVRRDRQERNQKRIAKIKNGKL